MHLVMCQALRIYDDTHIRKYDRLWQKAPTSDCILVHNRVLDNAVIIGSEQIQAVFNEHSLVSTLSTLGQIPLLTVVLVQQSIDFIPNHHVVGVFSVSDFSVILQMETSGLVVVDSYALGSRFGADCPICHKKVIYQQAHALCSCPISFHTHCFLNEINLKPLHNKPLVKCLYCQQPFHVDYDEKVEVIFNSRVTPRILLLSTSFLALLGVVIFCAVRGYTLLTSENTDDNLVGVYYSLGMFLSIVLETWVFGRVFSEAFTHKLVTAIQVRHLQKSIEFSAFKDLGFTEDDSNCTMVS